MLPSVLRLLARLPSWIRGDVLRGVAVMGAAVTLSTGCNHEVYSPPARMLPLESPATLGYGETGVQLEGGAHGAIFGPQGESGTVRVRRGIADGTDASGEVSVLHVDGSSAAGTYPYAFAARGGVKQRLTPWLSVGAGFGGGASAGGGFLSPDIGAVVGYENPYLVPFLSVRGGVSAPFATHTVDTSTPSDGVGKYVYTPPFTWVGGAVAGLRVPIGWCDPGPCPVRGSLLGGVGLTYLAGGGNSTGVASLATGGEIVF